MDFKDPKMVTIWLTRAIAYVAYAFLIFSEIILVQGFLLKLLGADPTSSYVQWAYRSLDRVMAPFRGIFTPVELDGDAVLDTSILFAMVIYGIIALLVRALLDWLTYRLEKLDRSRKLEEAQYQAEMAASAPYAAPAYTAPSGSAVPPASAPPAASSAQPASAPPAASSAQPASAPPAASSAQPASSSPPPSSAQPASASPPPTSTSPPPAAPPPATPAPQPAPAPPPQAPPPPSSTQADHGGQAPPPPPPPPSS